MFCDTPLALTRVLIASVDAGARSMFMQLAGGQPGVKIVGSIRSRDRVLERILLSAPDVLLIHADILRGETNMLRTMRVQMPDLKTLVCGVESPYETSGRLIAEGATDVSCAEDERRAAVDGTSHLLLAKLRAMLGGHEQAAPREPARVAVAQPVARREVRKTLQPNALLIGCSTGGPVALANLLKAVPKDFPLPIAIVQHMPALFTAKLAERLNELCPLDVREGTHGQPFVPGRVIIAPGDFHMRLRLMGKDCHVELDQGEREQSCRPAVNVLLRSAADIFGGHVLTVILTGMGKDGLQGTERLHALGSRVVVQDAATSTVWGMPGAVANAGLADAVLPLNEIIPDLMRYV